MQVIKIRKDRGSPPVCYYSLAVASKMITGNQWSVPVDGIHTETLRRSYRDSGKIHGTHIGRDVFFTEKNLRDMNYEVDVNKYHVPEEYVVWLPEEESIAHGI
tara:strand:- start:242 stop:550 length:309 start_codon:yes stop_codon:yes gene_type:complete